MTQPLARLDAVLAEIDRAVIAYSGGVDSALLAARAHALMGERALAVTAVSPSLARRDRVHARDLARRLGLDHLEVATHELDDPRYVRNAPDRCYFCKDELFTVLEPLAQARTATLLVGTNADDLGDHRPGLRAARERGVRAPLAEAALSKGDVRDISRDLGLPTAERPASPCLSSRIAYGVHVTPERLQRIDAAEELLRTLGFDVLRVRDHGELARIEVPPHELERVTRHAAELAGALKELGFRYVTLDLAGFRSGSLNEVLGPPGFRRDETPA